MTAVTASRGGFFSVRFDRCVRHRPSPRVAQTGKWSARLSYLADLARNVRGIQDAAAHLREFFWKCRPTSEIAKNSRDGHEVRSRRRRRTRPRRMNFASDNGAGVAPEILEAIVAIEPCRRARLRRRRLHRARPGEARRNFRASRRRLSRRHRHRRQRARARRADPPVGDRLLPRGGACPRGRMRRAGILHRGRKARRHPRRRRQDHPRGAARNAGSVSARAGQDDAAGRAVAQSGERGGHDLSARGSRRARLDRARGGPRRAYGRRALRQRARLGRRLSGRDDLARRRRRALARRDEERRARLRGGDLLRSRHRPPASPISASAPGKRCRRAGSSARRWRPI